MSTLLRINSSTLYLGITVREIFDKSCGTTDNTKAWDFLLQYQLSGSAAISTPGGMSHTDRLGLKQIIIRMIIVWQHRIIRIILVRQAYWWTGQWPGYLDTPDSTISVIMACTLFPVQPNFSQINWTNKIIDTNFPIDVCLFTGSGVQILRKASVFISRATNLAAVRLWEHRQGWQAASRRLGFHMEELLYKALKDFILFSGSLFTNNHNVVIYQQSGVSRGRYVLCIIYSW